MFQPAHGEGAGACPPGLTPRTLTVTVFVLSMSGLDTGRVACGRVYVTVRCPGACLSVRLSTCPSHLSTAACRCGGFAAVGPADRRSIDSVSTNGWLGSRVVSVLDSGAEQPGFKSQSRRCWVTVLGKLFTLIVPLFTKHA